MTGKQKKNGQSQPNAQGASVDPTIGVPDNASPDLQPKTVSENLDTAKQDPSATDDSKGLENVIKALEADRNALKSLSELAKYNEAKHFDLSRLIIYLLIAVSSLGAFANIGFYFYVLSTVGDGVKEASKYRQEAMDHFNAQKEVNQKVVDNEANNEKQMQLQKDELGNAIRDFKTQLSDAKESIRRRQEQTELSTLDIQEALTLISIGQQRLSEQDAVQSTWYAQQALKVIDEGEKRYNNPDDQSFLNNLKLIKRPASVLLCESLVQTNDLTGLRNAANSLSVCNCSEGAHYQALIELYEATDERTDKSARIKKMGIAKDSFQRAAYFSAPNANPQNYRPGNFDLVFLGAVLLDNGNYRQASKSCQDYISSVPNSDKPNLLRPRSQANVFIAKIILELADFLGENENKLIFPDDCAATPATLTPIEGQSLENLLREVRNTKTTSTDDVRNGELRTFCNKAIERINFLTVPPCVSIQPQAPVPNTSETIESATPPPRPESATPT